MADVPYTPTVSQIASSFGTTLKDFLTGPGAGFEEDFKKLATIEDVYDAIESMQEEQAKGKLRGMRRIVPYLDCLSQFSDAINTFVQMKPDVLGIIWAPIQVFIKLAKNHVKAFDKFVETMKKIQECLPDFRECAGLFDHNSGVLEVLCLFYREILEFYGILLSFLRLKGCKVFFESLWPSHANKIHVVMQNIENHKDLMRMKITLADIRDCRTARNRALEEYEHNRKQREKQNFEICKIGLSPRLYDSEFERLRADHCKDSCQWLWKDPTFLRWFKAQNRSNAMLWLTGIPGAGKSYLVASFAATMQQRKENILYIFQSFEDQEEFSKTSVLLSLVFQILYKHPELRPTLQTKYDSNPRELQASADFLQDFLIDLIGSIDEMTYLVIDGLDEVSVQGRCQMLTNLLDLSTRCTAKILLSSREVADISKLLELRVFNLRIERKNENDIKRYFQQNAEDWLEELSDDKLIDDCERSEIEKLIEKVPDKAEGMFLYVKLILAHLRSQTTVSSIMNQAENLPDGLDAAYGRILGTIEKLPQDQRDTGRAILEWMTCSKAPLRRQELLQALTIRESDPASSWNGRLLKSVEFYCGPIIEDQRGFIKFVHFTAKEYLCSLKSGPWIVKKAAQLRVAETLMIYLGSDDYDAELNDQKIDAGLLNGFYTLQAYAMSFWLTHVKEASLNDLESDQFSEFCDRIGQFLARRTRPPPPEEPKRRKRKLETHGARIETSQPTDPKNKKRLLLDLKQFAYSHPRIYDQLKDISLAMTSEVEGKGAAKGSRAEGDPLILSDVWIKCQKRLDSLLCPSDKHNPQGCACQRLESHYGKQLYKCNRYMCAWARIGFDTRVRRDRHADSHRRSFKCGFGSCPYTKIGFFSQAQLDQHMQIKHSVASVQRITEVAHEFTQATLEQAMLDSVEMGEADYLALLLKKVPRPPVNFLIHIAYLRGSKEKVLQCLADHGAEIDNRNYLGLLATENQHQGSVPSYIETAMARLREELNIFRDSFGVAAGDGPQTALTEAIEGGNLEVIRWLILQGVDVNEKVRDTSIQVTSLDYLCTRQQIRCAERRSRRALPLDIIQLLLDAGADVSDGRALQNMIHCAFLPEDESSYVEAARMFLEHDAKFKPDALHYMVPMNYSIALARLAIENGADLDAPFAGSSPLHRALKGVQKKAAEFARFLVESGAKNIPVIGDRCMDAKKFSKWARIPWDELLVITQHLRA